MLRKMVLPDNVAPPIFPQIFLRTDPKIGGKKVLGKSRHIMRQKWRVRAGKTMTFACVLAWQLPQAQCP
jgi:hypothetical protein